MKLRHRSIAVAIGLLAVAAIGRAQQGPGNPPDHSDQSGVQIHLLSCDPYAGQRDLRVARVRIRVGARPIELTDLQCGAFVPGTKSALFLNAVDGLGKLPAGTERIAQVVFPASRRHRECRCVIGSAVALRERRGQHGPEWWEEETWEPAPQGEQAPGTWPAENHIPGPDVLRLEVVLRPATELHREPDEEAPVLERLTAQERVDVLSIERGWKLVRRAGGLVGWIRSDTATPDLQAPARVGARLDELALTLGPDGTAPDALISSCPVSAADALPELVFALVPATHTVYVTNLWYALDDVQREAFHAWVKGCHEITRIVELATGAELRN
ncbi:MAG: SH3 domain-containing protein [bacterium]|nr:SH3 domain-containing protein [bacterium]